MNSTPETDLPAILSPAYFLAQWQGHRRLTRRVIEAFPADQLFSFSAAPPMRPFGEMAWEIHGMSEYILNGVVTDEWGEPRWNAGLPNTQEALLGAWDELSRRIEAELPGVPAERYGQFRRLAWGEMRPLDAILGVIDNETHHRGQGYVYLRALNIQPPDFWTR